jgi:hypothetical protein
MALRPTHTSTQWVPTALLPGVKSPMREAENSLLSSAHIKNWCNYMHSLRAQENANFIFFSLSWKPSIQRFPRNSVCISHTLPRALHAQFLDYMILMFGEYGHLQVWQFSQCSWYLTPVGPKRSPTLFASALNFPFTQWNKIAWKNFQIKLTFYKCICRLLLVLRIRTGGGHLWMR